MPSSKPLSMDVGNEGSMVDNSSSTNSRRIFEGGARSAEEARIPLLDEEEKGGGGGGVSETSSRHRRDGAEEDTGAGTRGFDHERDGGSARRDESDAPLNQADIAYGSNSFMAVVKPVALTMTLSAAITASLYSDAKGAENSAFAAYEVYDESSTLDTSTVRLGKSIVNAFMIVGVLAAATVVIVVMYWMRCMKCLLGYMAMSSVLLLGLLGGVMWKSAIEAFQIPCDAVTFYGFLWNFAVVGVVAIFYQKGIPTVVTQAYLVATSIIMAWHLSRFEEWTGWCLLVVLALYDLCAVLTPCGPLKALLHLMEEYDEPMPGLLYEAELPAGPHEHPSRRRNRNRLRGRRLQQQHQDPHQRPPLVGEEEQAAELTSPEEAQALIRDETALVGDGNIDDGLVDVTYGGMLEVGEASGTSEGKATSSAGREILGAGETPANIDDGNSGGGYSGAAGGGGYSGAAGGYSGAAGGGGGYSGDRLVTVESPGAVSVHQSVELVQPIGAARVRAVDEGGRVASPPEAAMVRVSDTPSSSGSSRSGGFLGDASALPSVGEAGIGTDGGDGRERENAAVDVDRDDRVGTEDDHVRLRRSRLPRRESGSEGVVPGEEHEGVSIKLGLGDFIFYSVLVTKAALYSFTAWATCVVVIVFGLGATLVLLAVYRMALPALPISIGLGTVFYLVTRLSMQPYIEAVNEAPLYF